MSKHNTKSLAWLHPHFCYWNGGTKFIVRVIRALSKFYKITVFAEDYLPEVYKEFENMGVKVKKMFYFSTNKNIYWLLLPIIQLYEAVFYKKQIKKHDCIISSMFPMSILANNSNSKKHIQFVFEPFAFFHDKKMIEGQKLVFRILMQIAKFIYKQKDIKAVSRSSKLMTVNQGVSTWIKKIYKRGSYPSYLIVDTDIFKPTKNNLLFDKYKDRKVVIHSTDYTPIKRTPFLLKNFRKVVEAVPDVLLLILTPVRDSDKKAEMLKLAKRYGIENNVEIVGFVNNSELPSYYSLARCGVYPGEGSGASACSYFVLEVMSCGTPVIRTSDSKEEVIDGENGYLFDPNDPTTMIDKLIKILTDDKSYAQMGISARKRISEIYNTDNVIKNFNNVINSVK